MRSPLRRGDNASEPVRAPGERAFVIAPLAAKPRPENAFIYGELTSGPTYLESDPIGLYGGSYSTYSYANNNPISNKDPRGLLVTIQARNPADQLALQNALDELKSTERGYDIWQQLDVSPMIYVIGDWVLGNDFRQPMNPRVNVDPNFHPNATTSCGQQPIPTSVALGHELGHLLRGDQWFNLNDEWNNVIQNENPIRQQLGLPLRTAYP